MTDSSKLRLLRSVRSLFFRLLLCRTIVSRIDGSRESLPLGKRGELQAERHLLKQGYWIIERSFSAKVGEIDLIASDGESVIFVEVKTRASDVAGAPTDAVDEEKQHRISQAARLYCLKNDIENSPLRFDVISIIWPDAALEPQLTHYRNAFESSGNFQMF